MAVMMVVMVAYVDGNSTVVVGMVLPAMVVLTLGV